MEHPFLFFTVADIPSLRKRSGCGLSGQTWKRVEGIAEERMRWPIPPEPPLVPPRLKAWRYEKGSFRNVDEAYARAYQHQYRVATMIRNMIELFSFCYVVTQRDEFLQRAAEWLAAPCGWVDWGAYASPDFTLGDCTSADLETLARSGGEVTSEVWDDSRKAYIPQFEDTGIFTTFKLRGLAIGYDWLHSHLPDELRQRVLATLIREGERLFYNAARGKALLINRKLNHTWFDISAFGLAGLSIMPDYPPAGDWVMLARDKMRNCLLEETIGQDGEFPEQPPLLWDYALTNACLFTEALRRVAGEDLFDHPGFRRVPHFLVSVLNPVRGLAFDDEATFDDADGVAYGLRPLMLRLAGHYRDEEAQWFGLHEELDPLGSNVARYYPGGKWFPKDREYGGYWEFLWLDETLRQRRPRGSASRHLRDVGWVMLRSGWERKDSFLALRSGPYLGPHDRLDQNKFVLCSRGERLVEKAHMNCYDRADFFRSTEAASTILVDGKGQEPLRDGLGAHDRFALEYKRGRSSGKILAFHDEGQYGYAIGDATRAYSGLERFVRYVVFLKPDRFLVLDDVIAENDGRVAYEWLLHTKGEIGAWPGGPRILKERAQLLIQILLPEVHQLATRLTPPDFCGVERPYLVVSPEGKRDRTRFLVALQAADPSDAIAPGARLVKQTESAALVEVADGGTVWEVQFDFETTGIRVRRR